MIRFLRNLFFFLLVLLAAVWVLFQSETVRNEVTAKIETAIFNATGIHIEMDAITFSFPRTLTAYNIRAKDHSNRLFLEADQVDFAIDLSPKFGIFVQQAKLYFIPELISKQENVYSPEIILSVDKLEIMPDVLTAIEMPSTIKLNHIILSDLLFLPFSQHQLSGKAYLEGLLKDKGFNMQTTFMRYSEGNIEAFFQAIYDAALPMNGKIHLSPNLQIDGTTFHIPSTEVASLESIIENVNDYAGRMQAEGSLYGSVTAPLIDLEVQAPTFAIKSVECKDLFGRMIAAISEKGMAGQMHLASFIDEKELFFNADFNYLFGEMLTFNSSDFAFGDLVLTNLKAEVPPSLDQQTFSINGEGAWKLSPLAFEAKGSWQASRMAIDAVAEIDGNKVLGSFSYHPDEVSGTFELQNLTLASLPVAGVVSLKGNISGRPEAPKIQLTLADNHLQIEEKQSHCDLSATIENGLFSSKGTLTISNLPSVKFDAQFPITFSLNPWVLDVNKELPLEGHLSAEGELSQILQHALDNPTSLSGNAKIVLNLAGTLQQPRWSGTIGISKGIYEIPEIGVLLKDLTAAIDVEGTRLAIKQISANDGKVGRVYGYGYYDINKEEQNPFILELTLQQAALLNQDKAKMICNGPLTFKGNGKEGMLSGQLQVEDGTIIIPERSYSTINTVDVTYINIPNDAAKPQSAINKKTPWPLGLDIHLSFPRTLTIEGKDLDSTWKGEIAVQGQGSSPQLFGELRVSDGHYFFNHNPFVINQGTITFAGDIDKKTTLYVIAERDLDRVKVDVIVKGPTKNPAISFRSNPPMPQREILSWLLFNRGTSQISPFQGAQLSESITNLSANQQGPDILSKIRSTFKIDRFEIGRGDPYSDNTGVNLEVGKYISDNILISVIKSDVNKIAIEANLTDRIKLQGQVGDDSQGRLLLKWKRDY